MQRLFFKGPNYKFVALGSVGIPPKESTENSETWDPIGKMAKLASQKIPKIGRKLSRRIHVWYMDVHLAWMWPFFTQCRYV